MNTESDARSIRSSFNHVKKNVRRQLVDEFQYIIPPALIRQAVDEAEQLAHNTGFPHLVFPLLAEEMVEHVPMLLSELPAAAALAPVAA